MKLKKKRDEATLTLQIILLGHRLGGRIWMTEKQAGGWIIHHTSKSGTDTVTALVIDVLKDHNLLRSCPWAKLSKLAEW